MLLRETRTMPKSLRIETNARAGTYLDIPRINFLGSTLGSIERLLPHVEVSGWAVRENGRRTWARWTDQSRRELLLELTFKVNEEPWCITAQLRRRRVEAGVGAIARTIDAREQRIACCILDLIRQGLEEGGHSETVLNALLADFEERVVALHLCRDFNLKIDLATWFAQFRQLAELSYENRALVFGCVIDAANSSGPEEEAAFPADYLQKKKYRALSDGFRTAYLVSGAGATLGFMRLKADANHHGRNIPEWCDNLASEAVGQKIGIALTRQGDILILDRGRLTFSYRFGRWQYWNHHHIVDLMRNSARVQRVSPKNVAALIRALYRAALDVSFRRSGGLFVLLRREQSLRELVRRGDAIGDRERDVVDREFDSAFQARAVVNIPRSVLCELAALDGAVVLNNAGSIMAYGVILEPNRREGILKAEGSRTKAAIGASHYGLAIKISSDGGMTLYVAGKKMIEV